MGCKYGDGDQYVCVCVCSLMIKGVNWELVQEEIAKKKEANLK